MLHIKAVTFRTELTFQLFCYIMSVLTDNTLMRSAYTVLVTKHCIVHQLEKLQYTTGSDCKLTIMLSTICT